MFDRKIIRNRNELYNCHGFVVSKGGKDGSDDETSVQWGFFYSHQVPQLAVMRGGKIFTVAKTKITKKYLHRSPKLAAQLVSSTWLNTSTANNN